MTTEKAKATRPKTGVLRSFVRSLRRNFWIDPSVVIEKNFSNAINRKAVYLLIDGQGFDYRVWAVASSGFFTDSYNLFAANVILPSIGYVYWPDRKDRLPELKINVVTLLGSLVGMLLFGILADRYGRRKLYGLELIVVIFGTLGIVQASTGYNGSMDIMGWLIFWRFFMGMGIGAEYPLSAVITAEFAPKNSRARMMAAVFLMQSLGQLAAALVGLVVLLALGSQNHLKNLPLNDATGKRWVDSIWRSVIGAGVFPALVAIVFRLTIPESPRFTLDVDHDGQRALEDIREHYSGRDIGDSSGYQKDFHAGSTEGTNAAASVDPSESAPQNRSGLHDQGHGFEDAGEEEGEEEEVEAEEEEEEEEEEESDDDENEEENQRPKAFSKADLYDYFITQGSWRFLAGTSITWFLLDFAFYGLGINNPRQIAHIWLSQPLAGNGTQVDDWQNTSPNSNIYDVLKSDAVQYIYTVSIGSVVGSLLLIKFIDYFPRKALLIVCFMLLAALFFLVGGTLFAVEYTNQHALTITLYSLCQLFFNLGPNALTFIISAEIFPTRYRCTCHGISAAFGKLGSICVQLALSATSFTYSAPVHLGVVLMIFGVFMGFGALFGWVWLPDVQDPRGPRKAAASLESGARSTGNVDSGINGSEPIGHSPGGEGRPTAPTSDSKEPWLGRYKIPSKSLEELAEGWKKTVERGQVLSFRRNLGIYNLLQPVVLWIQRRLYKQEEATEEQRQGLNGDWAEGDYEMEREHGSRAGFV